MVFSQGIKDKNKKLDENKDINKSGGHFVDDTKKDLRDIDLKIELLMAHKAMKLDILHQLKSSDDESKFQM